MRVATIFVLSLSSWMALPANAMSAKDNRLVVEGVVDANVDDVWNAFTTKKGLESWMVAHAEIEVKIFGKMRTQYSAEGKIGDANTIENTIISFDPKRMLSMKCTKTPQKFPFPNAIKNMWSVIYFEKAAESKTKVTFISFGFSDDDESKKMRAFFARGNAYTLKKLQERFAKKK